MDQNLQENQEIALTKIRRSIDDLGSSSKKYGDATLLRFLVARSMDPTKAAKMFVQWEKWRAEFVPSGFVSEEEILDELEARKIYLQGLTKVGHPLLIVKASKHFPSKDQPQFKKFVVHLLDKTIASGVRGREVGNEKLVGLLDLQGITYKNIDARGLITGFQFLQAYYPERLAKVYLLNMPWIFVSVWSVVCRFLEKATLEKVVIVSSEEDRQAFINEIGEEALPEEYGGRAKLVAVQDVKLNPQPLDD
ncbi:sec14 cytosolic factor [Magnolia sinica]|uniref:sec14 cytosolic factor n=1 Tax=Magnolia sinica TaxID=86752 RepID=UPI00265B03C5|nr:sec14 cytosolic factor [Magnolia sinica]